MWMYPNNVSELRQELLKMPYGLDVKVPKDLESRLLPHLQEPRIGDPKGAEREYRDYRKSDSLHIRVYQSYLKAHIDRKNPIYKPVQHLTKDAKFLTGGIIAGIGLTCAALWLTESW